MNKRLLYVLTILTFLLTYIYFRLYLENEIYRELYHNLTDNLVLKRISKQQRELDERQQERLDVEGRFIWIVLLMQENNYY